MWIFTDLYMYILVTNCFRQYCRTRAKYRWMMHFILYVLPCHCKEPIHCLSCPAPELVLLYWMLSSVFHFSNKQIAVSCCCGCCGNSLLLPNELCCFHKFCVALRHYLARLLTLRLRLSEPEGYQYHSQHAFLNHQTLSLFTCGHFPPHPLHSCSRLPLQYDPRQEIYRQNYIFLLLLLYVCTITALSLGSSSVFVIDCTLICWLYLHTKKKLMLLCVCTCVCTCLCAVV